MPNESPDLPAQDAAPDPASLTYEQAKAELRTVVQALESGSIPLEDTLDLWSRGEQLAARCKQILDEAAARLNVAEQG